MIEVYYGENRNEAVEVAKKTLGEGYEVIEGTELEPNDLMNIFWGRSLLSETRAILIRDFFTNKVVSGELKKFLETRHKIILLETKIDKRSSIYKELVGKIEFREFKMPRDFNAGKVFDIYKIAKRDGVKAVSELEKIETEEEPIMFVGLLASQALKDYKARPGEQEKKILKQLAKLDLELKSSKIEAWALVKACLLRLGR